jgi:hypothetical protein
MMCGENNIRKERKMKYEPTDEEFWKERRRLCKEHDISMIKAACYLVNYRDDFLCEDCRGVEGCEKIREVEGGKKTGEETGQVVDERLQDSVTEATDVG